MSEQTNKKSHVVKESQAAIYYGVVKGNTIVMPAGAHLTEGSTVEVRPMVQAPPAKQDEKEMLFKQRLLAMGLIKEIKMPRRYVLRGNRKPIRVSGKPLSETIVEERR
ncbi:MAG: hypothetical protein HY741_17495 [Chloroflexi bacterium]|nr:hypothetical protein [Chloroflexota bacterium]